MNIVDFCFCTVFETKRVHAVTVIYVLHNLKLKRWLKSNPVSVFYITQLGHMHCSATIAFILDHRCRSRQFCGSV